MLIESRPPPALTDHSSHVSKQRDSLSYIVTEERIHNTGSVFIISNVSKCYDNARENAHRYRENKTAHTEVSAVSRVEKNLVDLLNIPAQNNQQIHWVLPYVAPLLSCHTDYWIVQMLIQCVG